MDSFDDCIGLRVPSCNWFPWFTRYQLPQRIVFDRGTKFISGFVKMCQNDYGLKRKPITPRNPQSNSIIKRIHQNIGNIIRTFDVSNIVNNNP